MALIEQTSFLSQASYKIAISRFPVGIRRFYIINRWGWIITAKHKGILDTKSKEIYVRSGVTTTQAGAKRAAERELRWIQKVGEYKPKLYYYLKVDEQGDSYGKPSHSNPY